MENGDALNFLDTLITTLSTEVSQKHATLAEVITQIMEMYKGYKPEFVVPAMETIYIAMVDTDREDISRRTKIEEEERKLMEERESAEASIEEDETADRSESDSDEGEELVPADDKGMSAEE